MIHIMCADRDYMLKPGANESTTLTHLGPLLAGPSVWVEVEDDGAGGELVSMGCDASAPLREEEDGGREEEDWGTSGCEWELLSLDTPYNTNTSQCIIQTCSLRTAVCSVGSLKWCKNRHWKQPSDEPVRVKAKLILKVIRNMPS